MAESAEFDREIDCLPTVLDFVEAFVFKWRLGEDVLFSLNFVTEELFANMVMHNVGGDSIFLSLDKQGAKVLLEIVDRDVEPFEPKNLVAPVDTSLPMAHRSPDGFGLHLVKSIVDEISYGYRNRMMTVKVTKRLNG